MTQTNFNSRNEVWVKRKKHITATETGFNADAFGFKLGLFKGFAVAQQTKSAKTPMRRCNFCLRKQAPQI
jgi:hypothetical protein